jgi:hypothetical protein
MLKKIFGWSAIIFAVMVVLFVLAYRPWALRWGATDEEVKRAMVGDHFVANPTFNATRAVTIKARPSDIWPWIVQIGYKKAGFYSYDILDNDGIPSAERIIPEYQDLKVGDLIPLTKSSYVKVAALEPNEHLLLTFENETKATWAWGLYKKDAQHTRLITRLRVTHENIATRFLWDAFEIVMMRKCLLGIKRRAESAKSNQADGRRYRSPVLWHCCCRGTHVANNLKVVASRPMHEKWQYN